MQKGDAAEARQRAGAAAGQPVCGRVVAAGGIGLAAAPAVPGPVAEGASPPPAAGAERVFGRGAAGAGAGRRVFVHDRPRGVFPVGGGKGGGVR